MIRTQIYIPETLQERAKRLARSKKQSVAKLYRNFIAHGLKQTSGKGDLTSLIKLRLKGSPRNLSEQMDKYLYGEK